MGESDAKIPDKIGRYDIEGRLGSGAMGAVYKGFDPLIKRTLAIKTIRLDIPREGDEYATFLERFYQEARISGTLSHPNIVTLYDIGEENGVPFLALEFVDGESVEARLDRGETFRPEHALGVISQLASAIDYAHEKGIIHRDIKPANLLIFDDDRIKVTDFGITKLADSEITKVGQLLGTPSYMSPEQALGEALGRSDLFSLGVCAFEMLSGEQPFPGDNVTAILYKLVHMDPIEPENLELKGLVPDKWHEVFPKILAKSRDDRYQTGAEFVRDLEYCLGTWFGGALPESAGEPASIQDFVPAPAPTPAPVATRAPRVASEPKPPPLPTANLVDDDIPPTIDFRALDRLKDDRPRSVPAVSDDSVDDAPSQPVHSEAADSDADRTFVMPGPEASGDGDATTVAPPEHPSTGASDDETQLGTPDSFAAEEKTQLMPSGDALAGLPLARPMPVGEESNEEKTQLMSPSASLSGEDKTQLMAASDPRITRPPSVARQTGGQRRRTGPVPPQSRPAVPLVLVGGGVLALVLLGTGGYLAFRNLNGETGPNGAAQTTPRWPGASITVGEIARGISPTDTRGLELKAHQVVAELEGFDTVFHDLELTAENPQASVSLELAMRPSGVGTADILSIPTGAQVFLGREAVGRTPLYGFRVPLGTHRLTVTTKGFQPLSRPLTIEKDKKQRVTLRLVPVGEPPPAAAPPASSKSAPPESATAAATPRAPGAATPSTPRPTPAPTATPAPTPEPTPEAPTPEPVDTARVYYRDEVDVAPKKLSGSSVPVDRQPRLKSGETVSVTVSYIVDQSGDVVDIKVVESGGGDLDAALVETLASWKYEPGSVRGTPVKVRFLRKFSFRAG